MKRMCFALFPNIILIYRMALIFSLMHSNYSPLPIPRRQAGRLQYVSVPGINLKIYGWASVMGNNSIGNEM